MEDGGDEGKKGKGGGGGSPSLVHNTPCHLLVSSWLWSTPFHEKIANTEVSLWGSKRHMC